MTLTEFIDALQRIHTAHPELREAIMTCEDGADPSDKVKIDRLQHYQLNDGRYILNMDGCEDLIGKIDYTFDTGYYTL